MKDARRSGQVDPRRYELQAQIIGALAHPIRVAIADLLSEGEVCVCEIAERVGAERSNVSRHLSLMLKAGVLKTRKQGLQVYYSLRTPCILSFLSCATRAIEQNIAEQREAMSSSR